MLVLKTHQKKLIIAAVALLIFVPIGILRSTPSGFQRTVVLTDPIVGSFSCVIPPAGGAPQFTVIKNLHAGGTESEIDNAAPPSLESPTVGTWRPVVDDQGHSPSLNYSQDAYQMIWDPNGNFIGTFHYSGPMTLDPSLSKLTINGNATLVDSGGSVLTSFPFTADCSRL